MNETPARLLAALITATAMHTAAAEHTTLPGITVSGQGSNIDHFRLDPRHLNTPGADSAQLLRRIPGANVNSNGPLTGIAQYRGMSSERVNTVIGGMHITPGGPNTMDPPLSYIPRAQLESLEMLRGIAPVSSGNETIGGTLRAEPLRSHFADSDQVSLSGLIDAGYHGVDNGYSVDLFASLANRHHRAHIAASRQRGDDTEFDQGTIHPTGYERDNYRLGYGYRQGAHRLGLEYERNDTGQTGTPALPMDIIFIKADLGQVNYRGQWGPVTVDARVAGGHIDHRMDNFDLRTPPRMMGLPMRRFTNASSDSFGYGLDASLDFAGGVLKLGADGDLARHDADIFNPGSAAFLIRNYNAIQRDVHGFFGEWQRELAKDWRLQLGLRYTRVEMDAGKVSAAGLPATLLAQANVLAGAFNAGDRSRTDDNVDLVLDLRHTLRADLDIAAGFGRKTRSPSYQQRYLWLPLESTGGLADGNNYIGNVALSPEVAYQFDLGLDWHRESFYVSPRAFYHHVDDYIEAEDGPATGAARTFHTIFTAMTGSSAKLLRFANVPARLYGVDAEMGYIFSPSWRIDGTVSWVQGERRDNGDNLYRIAPLNARFGLTHDHGNWSANLETILADNKDAVSAVTNERRTPGYILLNLSARYVPPNSGFTIRAGIDNLLDKTWRDHLGGINRVSNSDVNQLGRIPGPGRNLHASLSYRW